ncbi:MULTISPECIES: iron-containing redox enzyme family protein [Kitasatospora]|uniref:Iron-containing redox enzyme family protein n=1 Tax=Kitasatospora setae (strain ATCC 33774 / DSM 43861 / JCM 3304 / KCC A-0304 / NBRC 14216 / KM-6054) TaxID=452652 RepID=E4NBY8_KITSK|nr:iron-containing redox enzyme family protein [Kitasatospora setae]BAJ28719.1 hypothetical protein KSE_29080 [Kitasatospora setae KM-6054]
MPTTSLTARLVFARACAPESLLPGDSLRDELRAELRAGLGRSATPDRSGESLDGLRADAARWADEERGRFTALLDRAATDTDRDALVRRAALSCAPLSLLSGAWLQWLSAPGNAERVPALRVLNLYAADLGAGHPHASRGAAYLALLQRLELAEHAVPAARLAQDQRIDEDAFGVPALLLALGRRPEDFGPEIVGADLCLREIGLPPALAAVRRAHPHLTDWAAVDPGAARRAGEPDGRRLALDAAEALGAAAAPRVAEGFRWALGALRAWSARLHHLVEDALDPVHAMAELMRQRAREGSVYHHEFAMEGRSLSLWLTECRTDPLPFLDVLARSRMVKPGRSEASSLVNGLVGERGPMFRVFSPEDLAVVRRWIDSLPPRAERDLDQEAGPAAPAARPAAPPAAPAPALPSFPASATGGDRAPADLREAYWLLLRRDTTPAAHDWAHRYASGWLARSGHGLDRAETRLPAAWPAEGMRPWLSAQHDRHGAEFEEGREVPVPTREELVDSTVQLAPLTLIDGAWLQGFTEYEDAGSEVGFSLFETYWDELGNGEPRLNHPLIYRQVLAEMGQQVPPTDSREFARWPGFRDGSFELPVYWLSVGRFPHTFRPEILGLNLAMELSGVGGSYRRARIALKTHGFSTRFVDLHNTIDNVSTGHSAWAADAVDAHMATVPATRRAEEWARVRTGYRSLTPPSGFRARQAQRRAQHAAPPVAVPAP